MLEQSGSGSWKARAGKGSKCGLARNLHVQLKTKRFDLDRKTRKLPPVLYFQTWSPAALAGGKGAIVARRNRATDGGATSREDARRLCVLEAELSVSMS
jgi:hypothetical protein